MEVNETGDEGKAQEPAVLGRYGQDEHQLPLAPIFDFCPLIFDF